MSIVQEHHKTEAASQLQKLGFADIKFVGTKPRGLATELVYTHTDGEPVMDAPLVIVNQNGAVVLKGWTERDPG